MKAHSRPLTRVAHALPLACLLLGLVSHAEATDVIERVVAVVNDEAIFLSELRRRAAPFMQAVVENAPEGQTQQQLELLYDKMLQQLVDDALIEQTSREMRITVSALEVDQALSNVRQQNGLSEDDFWQAVRQQGFTPKQYRDDVRKQLLRLKVINQKVRTRVNVTEDEVREAYDTMVRKARRSQRFHAAHLFFELPPDASPTSVSATMRRAEQARAELQQLPPNDRAARLAAGDLGWLNQGDLPDVLENTLLDLGPGDLSAPVRGPSGVHVFLLRERKQGGNELPSFEEAKGGIEQQLMGRAMQRQENLFLEQLRKNAVIDRRN